MNDSEESSEYSSVSFEEEAVELKDKLIKTIDMKDISFFYTAEELEQKREMKKCFKCGLLDCHRYFIRSTYKLYCCKSCKTEILHQKHTLKKKYKNVV